MAAFANLTEAQRERLLMLMEAAGRIVQTGCVAIRHGYDGYDPNDEEQIPHSVSLERGIEYLLSVLTQMNKNQDITPDLSGEWLRMVWNTEREWTQHQEVDE